MTRILLTVFLLIGATSGSAQPPSAVLFQAIGERLSYMQDVALYKAAHFLPVEDLERETVVLARALENAASAGLDAPSVESFFEAQIAVAKAIQYRYRAELVLMAEVEAPQELVQTLRPRLLELGNRIVEHMAADLNEYGPFQEAQFPAFAKAVAVPYVSDRDTRILFDALQQVRLSQQAGPTKPVAGPAISASL